MITFSKHRLYQAVIIHPLLEPMSRRIGPVWKVSPFHYSPTSIITMTRRMPIIGRDVLLGGGRAGGGLHLFSLNLKNSDFFVFLHTIFFHILPPLPLGSRSKFCPPPGKTEMTSLPIGRWIWAIYRTVVSGHCHRHSEVLRKWYWMCNPLPQTLINEA